MSLHVFYNNIDYFVWTLYRELSPGQPFTVSLVLVTVSTCQGVSLGAIVMILFGSAKDQKRSTQSKQFKYLLVRPSVNTNVTVVINTTRNI